MLSAARRLRSIEVGRSLAASLILIGLLIAAGTAVAMAWTDYATALDERDATADLLARSVDAGRRNGVSGGPRRQIDPFIAAETETLAAAAVESVVRSVVAEAGSSLLSSRAEVKPAESDIAGRIEAQAIVDGSNDALQAVLMKLEAGPPLMLVEQLSIVPADEPGNPQAPQLRMTVTLSAYWRKAAAKAPS